MNITLMPNSGTVFHVFTGLSLHAKVVYLLAVGWRQHGFEFEWRFYALSASI